MKDKGKKISEKEIINLESEITCQECSKFGSLCDWGRQSPKDDTCKECKSIRALRRIIEDLELMKGRIGKR